MVGVTGEPNQSNNVLLDMTSPSKVTPTRFRDVFGTFVCFYINISKVGYNCMWYSSNVTIPGSQTLDDEMRTFTKLDNDPDMEWWVGRNPWMSPGSAPVFGPCGAAGGFPRGCPWGAPSAPADDCSKEAGAMGGFSYGPLATEYDFKVNCL